VVDGWAAGFAVRRDWPDGTHEFVGFTTSPAKAMRFVRRDRRYWRSGPLCPLLWQVILISRRDFDLHRRRVDCRAPDCPIAVRPVRSRQHLRGRADPGS
jgi:hypothetical protein